MARRKAPRLTASKKKSKAKGADPEAPSDTEWKSMKPFGSFALVDDEGKTHKFGKEDTVLLLPAHGNPDDTLEDHEMWVAKIKEVKARPPSHEDVWVLVQWYWSPQEVGGLIKSFQPSFCGKWERIMSDHFDFVSPDAVSGHVKVHKYFEDRINQQDIPDNEFYCRYTLEVKARNIEPKPIGSCICARAYNPDDSSPESIMHFCPRPNCRRWYHRTCLLKSTYIDTSDSALLPYRLLASSPDTDEPFQFPAIEGESLFFDPQPPLKKHKAARPPKSRFKIETEDNKMNVDIPSSPISTSSSPTSPIFKGTKRVLLPELSTPDPEVVLSSLPTDLVTLAQQPIIKGGAGSNSKAVAVAAGVGGIVGNLRPVIQARRLVYDAVMNGGTVSDDWEESVDADVEKAISVSISQNTGGGGRKGVPKLCCPECRGPI